MSHDGEERLCFMLVEPGCVIDDAVEHLRSVLGGRRKPPSGSVRLVWSFGYGMNRSIAEPLAELVELPWVPWDLDDETVSVSIIEATEVAAALRTFTTVVADNQKLADRVLELTEEEVDVSAVNLDDDDETTSGRLVRAARLLKFTLERAQREGAGLVFGVSGS
jgi:hypothetical protein